MQDFHEYLESFFNPDTRQKVGFDKRNELLAKYAGDPTVFVSFTSIPKLGINPQSPYDTPIGIYAYPVDYVLDKFGGKDFRVPFAGDAPYLQVFRVKNSNKLLVLKPGNNHIINAYQNIQDSNTPEDAEEKLRYKKYAATVRLLNKLPGDMPADALEVLQPRHDYSFRNGLVPLWLILGFSNVKTTPGAFGSTKYAGPDPNAPPEIVEILDQVEKTWKHYNKKLSDLRRLRVRSFTNHALKQIPKFPMEDRLKTMYLKTQKEGGDLESWKGEKFRIVTQWAKKSDCNASFVWYMSRTVAGLNPRKWNWVLRSLGIDSVVDHGTGTIHGSEPTQAWFAGLDVIQHLTTISNVSPLNRDREGFQNFRSLVGSKITHTDNPETVICVNGSTRV